jgi:glutathione S-transferase
VGQVPVLSVDRTHFAESEAILTYCGEQSGQYPRDDDAAALAIDEVLGVCSDILSGFDAYAGPYMDILKEARDEFRISKRPKRLGGPEKFAKSRAEFELWICGNKISVADLQRYFIFGNLAVE